MENQDFKFKLKGKALVCIDWANVYGWQEGLDWKIDAQKLIKYLLTYPEVFKINFYFGTDITKKSRDFINSLKQKENDRFFVRTKDVKYVPVDLDKSYLKLRMVEMRQTLKNRNVNNKITEELDKLFSQPLARRKCDFDIEIALDVFNNLDNFSSFILFSGDGDYAPLIEYCLRHQKQTIVVALPGNLGKEYRVISRGLYICNIKKLRNFISK
ncbi:MAG: NYN domain-containing protein [Candidatus Nealsonbacteria bacterium]|nr:NYN domain-containing protein [Candidatus Nealsonbacteria bacterium]